MCQHLCRSSAGSPQKRNLGGIGACRSCGVKSKLKIMKLRDGHADSGSNFRVELPRSGGPSVLLQQMSDRSSG